MPGHPVAQCVGYVSILVGAFLWWLLLTYIVDKVRTRFEIRGVFILNRTIGIIVILAAIAGFVFTVTGLYSPVMK